MSEIKGELGGLESDYVIMRRDFGIFEIKRELG